MSGGSDIMNVLISMFLGATAPTAPADLPDDSPPPSTACVSGWQIQADRLTDALDSAVDDPTGSPDPATEQLRTELRQAGYGSPRSSDGPALADDDEPVDRIEPRDPEPGRDADPEASTTDRSAAPPADDEENGPAAPRVRGEDEQWSPALAALLDQLAAADEPAAQELLNALTEAGYRAERSDPVDDDDEGEITNTSPPTGDVTPDEAPAPDEDRDDRNSGDDNQDQDAVACVTRPSSEPPRTCPTDQTPESRSSLSDDADDGDQAFDDGDQASSPELELDGLPVLDDDENARSMEWTQTAQELAEQLGSSTDPRAVQLREALSSVGFTAAASEPWVAIAQELAAALEASDDPRAEQLAEDLEAAGIQAADSNSSTEPGSTDDTTTASTPADDPSATEGADEPSRLANCTNTSLNEAPSGDGDGADGDDADGTDVSTTDARDDELTTASAPAPAGTP